MVSVVLEVVAALYLKKIGSKSKENPTQLTGQSAADVILKEKNLFYTIRVEEGKKSKNQPIGKTITLSADDMNQHLVTAIVHATREVMYASQGHFLNYAGVLTTILLRMGAFFLLLAAFICYPLGYFLEMERWMALAEQAWLGFLLAKIVDTGALLFIEVIHSIRIILTLKKMKLLQTEKEFGEAFKIIVISYFTYVTTFAFLLADTLL